MSTQGRRSLFVRRCSLTTHRIADLNNPLGGRRYLRAGHQPEHERREQRKRERRIVFLSIAILVVGALVIAVGVWALIVLLIGAFG